LYTESWGSKGWEPGGDGFPGLMSLLPKGFMKDCKRDVDVALEDSCVTMMEPVATPFEVIAAAATKGS
jgi:hypothetical protein